MDEFDRMYLLALGGGGIMNIIVAVVTEWQNSGLWFGPPINYILGGFLLGMLVMHFSRSMHRDYSYSQYQ